LNRIGFEWGGAPKGRKAATSQRKWMVTFQKLVPYKEQHKNTMVPYRYNEDPQRGGWVTNQRRFYNHGELLPDQIDLLKSIGFKWDGVKELKEQTVWMDMFQKLVTYKEQHKNTMVQRQYKNDPKLGEWIHTQCKHYRTDKLLPNRINLLNSIDFNLDL
jgi:hypothetical protein